MSLKLTYLLKLLCLCFGYNLNYMSLKQETSSKTGGVGFGYNLNYMSLKPQIEAKLPG